MTEQHVPMTSDGLGVLQFPIGTLENHPLTDHIMGVVVIAWLTRFPIERWGEAWARSGSLSIRFRSHLVRGVELNAIVGAGEESLDVRVVDALGTVYASATFGRPVDRPKPVTTVALGRGRSSLVAVPAALNGAVMAPIEFAFEAGRDLAFTASLVDGEFWQERRWAHPTWLASGANALWRHVVEFADVQDWVHSGLELTFHEPVGDGERVVLGGVVDELFDGRRNRFAVSTLQATVDGRVAAVLRPTYGYAPLGDPEPV
jgi:hypothetical protein